MRTLRETAALEDVEVVLEPGWYAVDDLRLVVARRRFPVAYHLSARRHPNGRIYLTRRFRMTAAELVVDEAVGEPRRFVI